MTWLNASNGPYTLVYALASPPLVVPPLPVVPLPLVFSFPFTELTLGVNVAPFGATIPLVI
jgi:hypothetical protein